MNKIFKGITLSLAVLATVATSSIPASADEFYRHRHHDGGGDALAAGAIGLIAGTLIGGAMVQQSRPRRVYIDPPVDQYPQPVYDNQNYGDQSYGDPSYGNDAYAQPDPYYARPRLVYVDPYANNGYYQQPRVIIRRQVYQPSIQYYHVKRRAAPVYNNYGSAQPWTQEWYNYCSTRYRSFNPQTGTFRGRHGRTYFCQAG